MKCNDLKYKKYLLNFFLHLRNLHKIWNTLKEKVGLGGYLVFKLYTANIRVTEMPKKTRVRILTHSQHFKGFETLFKPARQNLCHISCSFRKNISSKSPALLVSKILRLFLNIFTPNGKYSLSVKASV